MLFTIPLRRSFIVDSKLQFPEGIATAKVLESGQMGPEGLRQIVRTGLAGGFFKLVADLVGLWPDKLQVSSRHRLQRHGVRRDAQSGPAGGRVDRRA